jgi:malto-oligosyltrehalose trehalohydrolase
LVRDYFIQNALYWLEEYHFDGLRLDAVHTIIDNSVPDFLTAMAETVRSKFGSDRFVHLILENYNNDAHYLESDAQGRARWYNAQWNDDVHHAAHVLVTGETDGYYSDYAQYPVQQLGRCLSEGFAYQGEVSAYDGANRGKSSRGLPPTSFISFLQNHDQIGNRAFGERILKAGNSDALKAIMEILLLAPSVPLLFMGEEFAATTPFLFFCDFEGELATKVTEGRRSEFAGFKQFNSLEMRSRIPDPNSEQTFVHSKLDWESLRALPNYDWLQFYRRMLALRRKFIIPNLRDAGANALGSFRTCGDGGLAVAWKLGKATLSLSANLAATPMLLTTRPQGRTIYAGPPDLAVELARDSGPIKMPAWSAAWFLRS